MKRMNLEQNMEKKIRKSYFYGGIWKLPVCPWEHKHQSMRQLRVIQLRHVLLILFIIACTSCDKDTTPPGEVTDLIARGEVEAVALSWTEPHDADLASIEITEVGADKIYALPSGLENVTIVGLTNGTSYEFAVVAVDENGNKSNAVHASATPAEAFVVVVPDQSNYESAVYVDHSDGYQTVVPSETFSIDSSGHVHMELTFNRPLDGSSVVSGQTVYFEGSEISPVNISISEDKLTLSITSGEPFYSFGTSSESASYTAYLFDIVLVGDDGGNGAILDSGGMPLDGDDDGAVGGDFVLEFTVNEAIPDRK
jgi:hypothetical protein